MVARRRPRHHLSMDPQVAEAVEALAAEYNMNFSRIVDELLVLGFEALAAGAPLMESERAAV